MNIYIKIFLVSMLCFVLMIGSGMYAFDKYYVDNEEDLSEAVVNNYIKEEPVVEPVELVEEPVVLSKLEQLISESNRVNVLVFGTDGGRADTIFLVSYDPDNDIMDLISVPRDTYHKVEGFDALGQNKINAIYGFKGELGGSKGMKYFIGEFLGVPIDSYVKVNYNGAAAVIDVIGGVKINIPFKMDYDDIYSNPELHVHFEPGVQTLSGKESVEYLRWRKNNGEAGAGDLGRIKRQQDFLKLALNKAIGLKLPVVAKTSLNYVRTDMSATDILKFANDAKDFDLSNLVTYQIPGRVSTDGHGFYIHDPGEMEVMFEEIYSRGLEE